MNKDNNIFQLRKRLLAILLAVTFIFCLLTARLAYLQVFQSQELTSLALDQWTRDLPIKAERGKIYDRKGEIIADNQTVYDLYVRPRMVKDCERTARFLADVLELDYAKILEKVSKKGTSELTLKKSVSEETMKKVFDEGISGVYYSISNERVYQYDELFSQVIGYCSVDGEGQSGLEQFYNEYMRGIDGQLLTQSDLVGKEIEESSKYIVRPKSGLDVYTTLDCKIQQIVENALTNAMLSHSPLTASAIVLDPNTSEIVALCTLPSFDLNNPPRDDLEKLLAYSRNTLLVDIYEPGSTFKIVTAAANLEEHFKGNADAFSPSHVFYSSPIRVIDGQTIKCWDKHLGGRHSNQTLKEALQNSCNPIFVDIAVSLGTETFYSYLNAFGYGKATGVDFQGEASGMLILKNQVKNCDLARIGFGQTIAVTGLQLINATSAAINGGTLNRPSFLKKVVDNDGKVIFSNYTEKISSPVSKKTSELIRQYMQNVVENGSGKQALVDGYVVGGKTGTAQKYVDGKIASGRYYSSFVGYIGKDEPEYICLVLIDEPQGGYYGSTVAAPIAREIFEGIVAYEMK